ncbi:MAG: [protein-PII] uridylyltransferase [Hahellaceae bacterium]|nr:[protein-PII] uridylyltransferase [Hahellaceae bacterium]
MALRNSLTNLLEQHPELSPAAVHQQLLASNRPIPTIRNALSSFSQWLNQYYLDRHKTRELVHCRSWFMDQILALLWQRFDWGTDNELSLVAVGGYGRGELHPFSDIDLLILARDEISSDLGDTLTSFITLLWDLRLDIGHSVRTVEECVQNAREDITIATNLLETRTISGNPELCHQLSIRIYSDEVCSDRAYFMAKREEQRLRHEKYSDTEYNLEPNIKASPGTLRDIQTIGWITKRHFGLSCTSQLTRFDFLTDEEYKILRNGETFLWKLRYGLQMLAGRNENRLLFDYQRKLAEVLGYKDNDEKLGVERMMQKYYRTVLGLAELTDVILQHFDEAILRNGDEEEVQPLNRRFQTRNRYIEVINPQIFAQTPYTMMEIFLLMAQNPQIKGIRATTIRSLRAHRHLIDKNFRKNLAVTTLFMEIFKTPHALHETLSYMKRYNVLGRYLPEFGRIIGQMQHDLFHAYTVDAHTLRVVKNMVKLKDPDANKDFPLASRLIHRIPKQELLYIAGFYHDIGKGRGGDHSTLGATDVVDFCQQHHLSQRDTQLVAWLVQNHLLMSMTAQRKDIVDPDVIHAFAKLIPSQVHLDYLYILTVTDIAATNPSLWNTWRASLLRQLYIEAKRALRRGIDNPINRDDWIAATKAEALDLLYAENFVDDDIDSLWDTLEDDYFLQDSTAEIAWQTASIIRHASSDQPLVLIKDVQGNMGDGYTQIMVYSRLRKDLFAATTAVLEQLNLNIVNARIHASTGHCALSNFVILDERNQPLANDPQRKLRVRERLIEELDDPDDYPEIILRRTPRQLKHFAFPTEVTFSNDMIHQRTLMEVITPDRPGLLARVGRILLENNVNLVNARIATLGERVEDVFFITDAQGQPLSDPDLCSKLQLQICTALDEQVLAS